MANIQNPLLWGNTAGSQQPVTQASAPSTSSVGANVNGFTPANGPSAVFSGAIPAVDYKANPYLLNQINQFSQMNPTTNDAFSQRMQAMGGQAGTLFNPVQDASLGQGLLGGDIKLNTQLPGYAEDNKVGYTDMYGNNGSQATGGTSPDGTAVGTPVGTQPVDSAKLWAYQNIDPTKLSGMNAKQIQDLYKGMTTKVKNELKSAGTSYKKALASPNVDDWRTWAERTNTLGTWNKQILADMKSALSKVDKKTKIYA